MSRVPQNDLNSLVRKNSLYLLSGKLVSPIVTFLVTVYIIRHLSVGEYGIYNVLLGVMAYVGLFSSLGLLNIFQRFIPEFRESGETSHLKRLVSRGLFLRFALSVLLILGILLFSKQAGRLLKIEGYLFYLKIFSLGIVFFIESQLLGLVLTSLFMHKYFVISQVAYTFLRAGMLYYLLASGWALNGLLVGEVAAFGFLLALQAFWYYRKFYRVHDGGAGTKFPLRRLLRYGGFSYFNEMGEQVLDVSTDFFIISSFLGAQMVGLYAFADYVMRLLSRWMPHWLLMDVITPSFFTRYSRTRDVDELNRMFNLVVKFIAFFFFPVVAGIFVLGDKLIVYVFDPKYLDALKVLWVVAGFTALNAFAFPLGLVVQSVERVEIHFFSKIFSVYNLVGDLLVVKPFGIMGVAVVTSSAILFKNLFTYFFVKKYVPFSLELKPLGIIGLNATMMAFIVFFLRGLVVNVVSFFSVVLVGGLIYLLVAYLHKGFTEDERRIVNKILPKPVFVF